MKIQPVKELVPREVPKEIEHLLNSFSDTIDECVNLGSRIIEWDDNKDIIDLVLTMQLRHLIDLMDSISSLIKVGSAEPSKLILRGSLETYFSILYILKESIREKSAAFIVCTIIDDIKIIERMIEKEEKQLADNTQKSRKGFYINNAEYNLKEILISRKNMLNSEDFTPAYTEYKRIKDKHPKWYQLFSKCKSIQQIANYIGQSELYTYLYTSLSSNIHGTDVISGKMSSDVDSNTKIHQIRSWENSHTVTKFVLTILINTFTTYINKRLPHKQKEYSDLFSLIQLQVNTITGHPGNLTQVLQQK